MDKSKRRTIIENGQWLKQNGGYMKEIIIHNPPYDVGYYYNDLLNVFKQATQPMQNVVEGYRQRNKGKKQCNYIGTLAGLQQSKNSDSFYSKKGQYIDMILPDGSKVKGIIRVADHSVDVGTFAEQNPDVDYGISLVVGKVDRQYLNKKAPKNRSIHIFEYILDRKYENSGVVLMSIIDRIDTMKIQGWNYTTNVGIRDNPKDQTNKEPLLSEQSNMIIINETHLRQMIREVLKEYISKQFKNR